jgi:hypothetical protein
MLIAIPSRKSTHVNAALVNCAPFGIEDLGPAVGTERLFQTVHADSSIQGVGQTPGEHAARVPVDDGHQVGNTVRQEDVGDLRTPHLVRARDLDPAQQIGVNRVLRVGFARGGSRRHARETQDPHQSLHPLAIRRMALRLQKDHQAPAAV